MSREIEWPPGSGKVATYSSVELRFVHALTKTRENETLSGGDFKAQIDCLHELKVLFGARMLSEEEEVERGYRAEGHGEFAPPLMLRNETLFQSDEDEPGRRSTRRRRQEEVADGNVDPF